jgi:hypothetical protein
MATSGSYTFSLTRDALIQQTFSLMGTYDDDSPPPQTAINTASVQLNLLMKQMMTKNYNLWCLTDVTIPLTTGKIQYLLGPGTPTDFATYKPLRIQMARLQYTDTGPYPLEVPLIELSRQEYNMLGQKTAPGTVNSWFYDPQRLQGILSLYLSPDVVPNTIILTVQRPIQDVLTGSDDFDLPIEWLNALSYNLAAALCLHFDVPANKTSVIIQLAQKYLDEMLDFDQETASTFFSPNMRLMDNKGAY